MRRLPRLRFGLTGFSSQPHGGKSFTVAGVEGAARVRRGSPPFAGSKLEPAEFAVRRRVGGEEDQFAVEAQLHHAAGSGFLARHAEEGAVADAALFHSVSFVTGFTQTNAAGPWFSWPLSPYSRPSPNDTGVA